MSAPARAAMPGSSTRTKSCWPTLRKTLSAKRPCRRGWPAIPKLSSEGSGRFRRSSWRGRGGEGEVMHQELFLVGTFFVLVLLATSVLIGTALTWNRTLAREIDLKTQELLASQERLMHSERFAAVGEAAAYVSHEIKNPLMVIGGPAPP